MLCTPNNPTGNLTSFEDVQTILEGICGMLFLDNAYVEFSGTDYLPLMRKYENLVIGRTFSKVHSLAGLRIGYAFVPAWLQPFYLSGWYTVYGEYDFCSSCCSRVNRQGTC